MKTKFLLLATALFCLASCNNAEFDNNVVDLGGNSSVTPSGDVYTIEIEGSDPLTKGNAALQSLGIANLSDEYTETPTAHLKKNGKEVSASFTWSLINSGGSYINLTNNKNQQAILTALAVKSQANLVHVMGTDGVGSAEIDVPVVVADNFSIDWAEKSMTLTSGVEESNTVQTNHAGATVTVSCPSDCKIGKSSASGTSSVDLTTDENGKATVKVMYTGTSDKTLSLTATASIASGSHSTSSTITGKPPVTLSSISLSLNKSSVVVCGSATYTVMAKYSDNSTEDITSKATMSSTNSTGLSVSGGNITTSKAIGCLGQRSITASYNGKTDSQNFTVTTDYMSDDIKLSWSNDFGRSGEASSGTLNGYVKRNDASSVTVSFSGNLKTSNSDTYAVSSDFIEFYVKDVGTPNYSKASTSQTYRAQEGDGEVYELRYLGESVKTWTINWYGY